MNIQQKYSSLYLYQAFDTSFLVYNTKQENQNNKYIQYKVSYYKKYLLVSY